MSARDGNEIVAIAEEAARLNAMIPPSLLVVTDDKGRTVVDRLKRDLARADRLQHSVAVVGKEDLRAILG